MKIKSAITTLILVLIFAGAIVTYFVFFNNPTKKDEGVFDNDLTNTFFPIADNNSQDSGDNDNDTTVNDYNSSIPKLRQISNVPIAGFISFEETIESEEPTVDEETGEETYEEIMKTYFRYVERATGNIYEANDQETSITRLTNTTIPKIYEALFTNDGEGVVLRYLDNAGFIDTFVGNINREEEEVVVEEAIDEGGSTELMDIIEGEGIEMEEDIYELVGTFLPKKITTITKSPVEDRFFYLIAGNNGSTGYVFDWETPMNGSIVFESDATKWLSDWYKDDEINIYTKPSYFLEGFSFILNPESKSFNKLVDNSLGLTTKINIEGTKILMSYSDSSGIKTAVYDLIDHELTELSIKTLSDKCVWETENTLYCAVPRGNTNGDLPDDWYQGLVRFSDDILYINTEERTVVNLDSVDNYGFDITNLQLSPSKDYLMFMNKKDLTLWSLDVSI